MTGKSSKKARTIENVGYGRPPREHRFERGKSGNPRGRPKGSLNLTTACKKAIQEKITVQENGRRKTISKLEALFKQVINKAISGDIGAARLLLQVMQLSDVFSEPQGATPEADARDREVLEQLMKRLNVMPTGGKK